MRSQVKLLFNLIEVTLAIAVVGIGIAGVMSLFPVGVQASRDAIGDNYAADSVEQVLVYLASASQNNWASYISSDGTDNGTIKEYASASVITDASITLPLDTDRIANTNLFSTSLGNDVFCIKQPATGNADFVAHVKLWKAPISNMTIAGVSGITLPYFQTVAGYNVGAARIYAEVSWPVQKPYSKRTKRVYAVELFKQN